MTTTLKGAPRLSVRAKFIALKLFQEDNSKCQMLSIDKAHIAQNLDVQIDGNRVGHVGGTRSAD